MPNYTQITEEVYDILKNAQAYEFNCRGKIKVKGKGDDIIFTKFLFIHIYFKFIYFAFKK